MRGELELKTTRQASERGPRQQPRNEGVGDSRGSIPGVILGLGLGGLADGIVFHQLLQWHHLISERRTTATVAGLEANTLADGVFHAVMWIVLVVGLVEVVQTGRRHDLSAARLAGAALVGWGVFNVVDQLVFHLALDLHHIREGANYAVYDWSVFGLGVVLIAAGVLLAGSASGER
jgi:uncharacterized membrane protein